MFNVKSRNGNKQGKRSNKDRIVTVTGRFMTKRARRRQRSSPRPACCRKSRPFSSTFPKTINSAGNNVNALTTAPSTETSVPIATARKTSTSINNNPASPTNTQIPENKIERPAVSTERIAADRIPCPSCRSSRNRLTYNSEKSMPSASEIIATAFKTKIDNSCCPATK